MKILRRMRSFLVLIICCSIIQGASGMQGVAQFDLKATIKKQSQESIDDFFYKLFISEVATKPQKLSVIGLPIDNYEYNAYLNDVSPLAMVSALEEKKVNLQRLQQLSDEALTYDQKISYKVFLWGLQHAVNGEKFLFHDYHICHLFGIIPDLTAVFIQFHPLKTPEHVDLYITRLGRVAEQLQQCIALLEHQKKMGIVPPAFTLSTVINMIKALLPPAVEDNSFYAHLAQCIQNIQLSNKDQYVARAADVIKKSVYPAYQALQQYLETMVNQTTQNNGVWALPYGDEYYAYKLKEHTTTDLTADQIHELGLQEVQKAQEEVRKILREEHVSMQDLFKDPKFYYPEIEDGRRQCLTDYQTILERSRKELSPLFDLTPHAGVKIQAVPSYEEETACGAPHYEFPTIDGSRPGVVFVNLHYMHDEPKFMMEATIVHEAEPGHHFQISLELESNMPILRKLWLYTAYVEGWALYVEKLAYEQGFYSSRLSQLGYWLADLLRAARLVVDTGIHRKKWTREQAIDYMMQTTGHPKSMVISEVDRYFVYPGQACSYKIGQLKILELRQRAKDALGKKFDIREFHNTVLKLGAVPLTILEEVVDQYIQEKTKS